MSANNTITGARDIANITHELWERTADRLTKEELEWFAGATESATIHLHNLEDVIEGIGCLVSSDTESPVCDSFQNAPDVASLLFFFAESVRHARALTEVGDAAASRLRNPALYRLLDGGAE